MRSPNSVQSDDNQQFLAELRWEDDGGAILPESEVNTTVEPDELEDKDD